MFTQQQTRYRNSEMTNDHCSIPVGEWIIFSVATCGFSPWAHWSYTMASYVNLPARQTKPSYSSVGEYLHILWSYTSLLRCDSDVEELRKWWNWRRKSWPITPASPAIFDIRRSSSRKLRKKIRIDSNSSLKNLKPFPYTLDCVISCARWKCCIPGSWSWKVL